MQWGRKKATKIHTATTEYAVYGIVKGEGINYEGD